MKTKLLFLTTFLFPLYSNAQQTINGSFQHNNVNRSYILYEPAGYTGTSPIPLVLNFHGLNFSAQDQLDWSDMRLIADTAQFIVVHPQGTLFNGNTHWNVGGFTLGSTADDIGFTLALIDTISSQYNIDASRVYSMGFSNGGFFSFELACQVGQRITAIASVGGSMTPQTFNDCDPNHYTPVLQFHGTADNTVPYNGAGFSRPINTMLDYWVDFNEADTPRIVTPLPDIDSTDGSTVDHMVYNNPTHGAEVEHFRLNGDGHNWPGYSGNMDIDASAEIWKFFSRYTLDSLGQPPPSSITTRKERQLMVYPNPAQDLVKIKYDGGNQIDQIEMISSKGERFHFIPNEAGMIDVSNLSPGIYLIKSMAKGKPLIERLVIN